MPSEHDVQQFVLLPPRGLHNTALTANPGVTHVLNAFAAAAAPMPMAVAPPPPLAGALGASIRVLDSISGDGAKLVEMSSAASLELRAQQPGLRIVPVVYYFPAVALGPVPEPSAMAAAALVAVQTPLKVVSSKDQSPLAGAKVVAFTDFANRQGVVLFTDEQGDVNLPYGAGNSPLERVYVYAKHGFWNAIKKKVDLKPDLQIRLRPLDLAFTDVRRHFYADAADDEGQGVRVGVVDSGIAQHPDLVVEGGQNMVLEEDPQDFADSGLGHGTHVAGIIAGRGHPPAGMRGMAPAVILRSYRVFGQGEEGASSYAIAKAVDAAVADGCDLINMSLVCEGPDDAVRSAIRDARAKGSVVFIANGNDGRKPVRFPALDPLAIGVAALGRRGTYPPGSVDTEDICGPFGTDKKNFVAAFSNIGPETDLIAPGVEIVSTFPGGYAPQDGTSMACPAATGRAAQLLAKRPDILGLSRDQARSDTIASLVLENASSLGFEASIEGQGLP
jgi:subtilisin